MTSKQRLLYEDDFLSALTYKSLTNVDGTIVFDDEFTYVF